MDTTGGAPTAAFETLGCKVNQYETERIMASFIKRGFAVVPLGAAADVYVVNSCSVTQAAEAKSRKLIRRLRRDNPGSVILVTGCDVEMAGRTRRPISEATLLVRNPDKLRAVDILLEARPDLLDGSKRAVRRPQGPSPERQTQTRTRAVIKVQDGCDMFCTYCSVPLTRGPVRSRSMQEILLEVSDAVAAGRCEIVVAGILVGAYGRDLGGDAADLPDLLRAIAEVEGVCRVRLSSIEPTHVTDRLLALFAGVPALCRHLHIPLQSGDDDVLAAMHRPYDAAYFTDLCARAQATIPDLAVTTDVLVGFPGETERGNAHTVAVAERVGFARMHVFRYSARSGTEAAGLDRQVGAQEKVRRAAEMADLARALRARYAARFLGRTMDVLIEPCANDDGSVTGYTSNYIRVRAPSEGLKPGQIVAVRLCRVRDGYVEGAAEPQH